MGDANSVDSDDSDEHPFVVTHIGTSHVMPFKRSPNLLSSYSPYSGCIEYISSRYITGLLLFDIVIEKSSCTGVSPLSFRLFEWFRQRLPRTIEYCHLYIAHVSRKQVPTIFFCIQLISKFVDIICFGIFHYLSLAQPKLHCFDASMVPVIIGQWLIRFYESSDNKSLCSFAGSQFPFPGHASSAGLLGLVSYISNSSSVVRSKPQ
jgi:hypothetical protein